MEPICDPRHESWPLFLKTYAVLIDRFDRDLERAAGIPLTQLEVLMKLLTDPEGRMRMNDLAGSVLLSKSGVTRLVDRMERAGLVERTSCATDRRVVYAQITRKGRAAYNRAAPHHFRDVEDFFTRHLSAAESKALITAFQKIVDAQTTHSEERAAG